MLDYSNDALTVSAKSFDDWEAAAAVLLPIDLLTRWQTTLGIGWRST
jgi:hypothetical protein